MTQILKFRKKVMATKLKPYQLDICQEAVEIKLKAHARLKSLLEKGVEKELTDPFYELAHDMSKFLSAMGRTL